MKAKYKKLMFLAIQKGDFDQFLEHFENCSKVFDINNDLRNTSEDSPVHVAAQHGRLDVLRYLIEEMRICVDLRNSNQKTPLHDAAQFSQYEVVEFLISKGANINALKNADWTPLMLACTKLRTDVVSILLKNGADPLFRNKDGWNSFHIASREGSVPILQLLTAKLKNPTVEQIARLVNSSSNNGRKPLHTAALNGRLGAVEHILRNNFVTTVDDCDNCGTSPLMDSIRSGSTEIFDLLVKFGADIRRRNKVGFNCLHIAAEVGASKMICHLVQEYNFDLNELTDRGSMSAIRIAQREKHHSTVQILEMLSAKGI